MQLNAGSWISYKLLKIFYKKKVRKCQAWFYTGNFKLVVSSEHNANKCPQNTHSLAAFSLLNTEWQHQHKKSFITMIQWYSRTTHFKATMKITQQKWSPKTGGPRNGFIYIIYICMKIWTKCPPLAPTQKRSKRRQGQRQAPRLCEKTWWPFCSPEPKSSNWPHTGRDEINQWSIFTLHSLNLCDTII